MQTKLLFVQNNFLLLKSYQKTHTTSQHDLLKTSQVLFEYSTQTSLLISRDEKKLFVLPISLFSVITDP